MNFVSNVSLESVVILLCGLGFFSSLLLMLNHFLRYRGQQAAKSQIKTLEKSLMDAESMLLKVEEAKKGLEVCTQEAQVTQVDMKYYVQRSEKLLEVLEPALTRLLVESKKVQTSEKKSSAKSGAEDILTLRDKRPPFLLQKRAS